MYVLALCFISCFMFSCAEELVSPVDEGENVEVPSVQSNNEGGTDPKDPGNVKPG